MATQLKQQQTVGVKKQSKPYLEIDYHFRKGKSKDVRDIDWELLGLALLPVAKKRKAKLTNLERNILSAALSGLVFFVYLAVSMAGWQEAKPATYISAFDVLVVLLYLWGSPLISFFIFRELLKDFSE